MRLFVLLILLAGLLGIFEAGGLWQDGHRWWGRFVLGLSAAPYLAVALWYWRKPGRAKEKGW